MISWWRQLYWALVLFVVFGGSGAAQPLTLRLVKEVLLMEGNLPAKSNLVAFSINGQGEIYLVDQGLNRVFYLDPEGNLIKEEGGFGWENNQFDRPTDIWAENSLDVFVADYNNNRVQRFDRTLNYVASYTSRPALEEELQFAFPVSVTFSRFGELFLVEQEHYRVLRFNKDGEPEQSFGDYDWGAGTLQEPVAICLSEKDQVYVSDRIRKAVVCFDYYGNYLHEITHPDLQQPGSVATAYNYLFVVDETSGRVFVFHEQGEKVVDFSPLPAGNSETTETHLDLAVHAGILYILDSAAAKIYGYELKISRK